MVTYSYPKVTYTDPMMTYSDLKWSLVTLGWPTATLMWPRGNQVIKIFFWGGDTLFFRNKTEQWVNDIKPWMHLETIKITINFCATQTRNRIKIEQSRYMMIQHDETSRNTVAQMIKWNCTTQTQETTEATDTKWYCWCNSYIVILYKKLKNH